MSTRISATNSPRRTPPKIGMSKRGGREWLATTPTDVPEFGLSFAFFADPEGRVAGLSNGVIR
jgi:hypothetical protein